MVRFRTRNIQTQDAISHTLQFARLELRMILADLIRDAESESDVFRLLTAFVEALRYADRLGMLPQFLTTLPLKGVVDLESRFGRLVVELGTGAADGGGASQVAKEAREIFGTALHRLRALPPGGEADSRLLPDTDREEAGAASEWEQGPPPGVRLH